MDTLSVMPRRCGRLSHSAVSAGFLVNSGSASSQRILRVSAVSLLLPEPMELVVVLVHGAVPLVIFVGRERHPLAGEQAAGAF